MAMPSRLPKTKTSRNSISAFLVAGVNRSVMASITVGASAGWRNLIAPAADPLFDLLKLDRLPAVVDIGANPIDGNPPYLPPLKKKPVPGHRLRAATRSTCCVEREKSQLETYLPYAVSDGTEGTLR